ncbi:hypothetical protein DL96DRAFT_1612021 [Flagelloscypha sp. PMI_526]|nr:hypothetical protein DL96DRAFT_1612021 [Flagelloscypha sp. PMI_526]
MHTLTTLNPDVLLTILLLVHESSRPSIFSLLLVNSVLHKATLPFVYRRCTLDFTPSTLNLVKNEISNPSTATAKRVQSFLELEDDSFILRSIRTLVIRSHYSQPYLSEQAGGDPSECLPAQAQTLTRWQPLICLISRLKRIQDITFDCREPVPTSLLRALETYHPFTHLHVQNWTRRHMSTPVGDPEEEALGYSPCLRTLCANIYTGGPDLDYRSAALQWIAARSPNLENLHFSSRSMGGCVIYGFSYEKMQNKAREVARFKADKPMRKALKTLQWNRMSQHTIQDWQSFLDLDRLTSLIVGDVDAATLHYAAERRLFSNLRTLEFTYHRRWRELAGPNEDQAVSQFISSCVALDTLSITNYGGPRIVEYICIHLGHTLRSLALHNVEMPRDIRGVLSVADIQKLRTSIPRLESLEFDINRTRDGRTESDIYAILSSMVALRTVTIHYDLGLRSRNACGRLFDRVGEEFARHVWASMSERGPSRLEELTLFMGEPNREIGSGYPADWLLEEQERKQQLSVRSSDDKNKLTVKVEG